MEVRSDRHQESEFLGKALQLIAKAAILRAADDFDTGATCFREIAGKAA